MMTAFCFLGFFSSRWQKGRTQKKTKETKQKQKDTTTPKKKENKTKHTDNRNISGIIFVYTTHISIKDVRVEKILPREER